MLVTASSERCKTKNMLEKIFGLSKNGTTVRTELVAGLTTFMTMAYILAEIGRAHV